ncbi:3-phosphoshikimate 1-carboxyvinyltransferase, partial [Deltaproteobacteria bacterium OttesenSCG-928-K17]|nr:3-phosphoshikimate 1-carboxyvinyltransferase [Deltaproteobacteria bacterium OttesenSCG-928-K17]
MPLHGEFTPPGDKSVSHRIILTSILAEGETEVSGLCDCLDIKSSIEVFRALGGEIKGGGSRWAIKGLGGRPLTPPDEAVDLDCGNSGTTMRLLSGILAGLPGQYILGGDQQLSRRPMERLADPLRQMGARVETTDGHAPIFIKGGPLHGIEYINNDGSAQLKGAVLLAGLSAEGSTRIIETLATRDHTERLINHLGGRVTISGQDMEVFPGRLTLPDEMSVPGDPSAASFFLIAAAMLPDSAVTARNILLSNGRIGFLKVLDRMGASIAISLDQEKPEPGGHVTVEYNGLLSATEISREEIPSLIDEIPML